MDKNVILFNADMRYLFRGYGVYTRKWEYGYLLKSNLMVNGNSVYIQRHSNNQEEMMVYWDSVGIYTNVNDSIGKLIFEGDIISTCGLICRDGEWEYEFRGVGIRLCSHCGVVMWRKGVGYFEAYLGYGYYNVLGGRGVNVVGNLFEMSKLGGRNYYRKTV